MPHTSALIAPSLSWDNSSIQALTPPKARAYVEQESLAWQQMSQDGSAVEDYAIPSHARRQHIVNGRVTLVPKRPRRIPAPNRLLELHGLAGGIGEQLGLAWTVEQDVQRLIATSAERPAEHQRLVHLKCSDTELSISYLPATGCNGARPPKPEDEVACRFDSGDLWT